VKTATVLAAKDREREKKGQKVKKIEQLLAQPSEGNIKGVCSRPVAVALTLQPGWRNGQRPYSSNMILLP
jgi:hypothetical protein